MLAGSGGAITRLRARGTIINTYLHQSHQRHMCVLIRDPPSADQTRDLTEPSLYHAHKRCSRSQLFAPARQLPKETRRLQRWRRCTHLSRRIMMTVHSRSTSRRQSPLSRVRKTMMPVWSRFRLTCNTMMPVHASCRSDGDRTLDPSFRAPLMINDAD